MTSVVENRLANVWRRVNGALSPNVMQEAVEMWGPGGDVRELRKWMKSPITQRVLQLVQVTAETPPPAYIAPDDRHDALVLSEGVRLAARVMSDPTVLFSEVFKQSPVGTAPLTADYTSTGVE